ncbi:TetR/AcrR family transcriptional regulator [Geobacter sp. AOG1]|uniref:TetR/AcrR family transcriptional regulator n=1 Tax=Geobacter sp. AOG1 TaxID=1566346 RepID=UPI001CC61836|nr:TetR/AcrR family transcriptional regulator [Geobacter sp. AOG1]GFE57801.1 TetR family transcriptional regulator [Geobacter sp. AOG1]
MARTQPESDTRERILCAALKLFAEMGYAGACTKEIAREAGVAEVTLFRHFVSKDKLLEEVMSRFTFVSVMPQLLAEIAALPCEEALTTLAGRFIDYLVLRKDWVRIMQAEMQRAPAKLFTVYHAFLDDLLGGFVACFRQLQQRGCLGDFDLEQGARMFHGICFNYFNQEELQGRKNYKSTDRELVIREFVRIFLYGTCSRRSE